MIESLEIAGPGFINLRLSAQAWLDELRALAALGVGGGGDGGVMAGVVAVGVGSGARRALEAARRLSAGRPAASGVAAGGGVAALIALGWSPTSAAGRRGLSRGLHELANFSACPVLLLFGSEDAAVRGAAELAALRGEAGAAAAAAAAAAAL
jgi:hypothetical protein